MVFESIDSGIERAPNQSADEPTRETSDDPADGKSSEAKPGDGAPKSDAGEETTEAPSTRGLAPARASKEEFDVDTPRLAATIIAAPIYNKPHSVSRKLGYIRLGGIVRRDQNPVAGSGCKGKWYRVYPEGFVCTEDATIDMQDPLVRATRVRPKLDQPLPYAYGFVRATAPQYLRLPSKAEQIDSEFKLEEHLAWYREHRAEVQRVTLGANDVPLDEAGLARLGHLQPADFVLSTQKSTTELLGGSSTRGEIPFWLEGGQRQIPNVSGFEVPDYAVFADRVRRKTGLSFVDAFMSTSEDITRRFGLTVDMRLIPATKVKPDTGSPFHGVEIAGHVQVPFAFVAKRGSVTYKLLKGRDEVVEDAPLPRRAIVPLTGKARFKAGTRYYQIARNPQRWLRASDVGVIAPPATWPAELQPDEKWIDISLVQQTLVLYEGKKPIYATLVSTGRDRLGDPETTMGTPQGTFRIKSKHIAAAMDSEENSNVSGGSKGAKKLRLSAEAQATVTRLLEAEKAGKQLEGPDRRRLLNIKKGRHPEYGVTMRRGAGDFELRDVPWIQYFSSGYALHGAYWHDVFGTPRSHGCINLAPIDARFVFNWTEPAVPDGWHGLNVSDEFGRGTLVSIRE